MKKILIQLIQETLQQIKPNVSQDQLARVQIERSREEGDFASNSAMLFAKQFNETPRHLAEKLKSHFPSHPLIDKIEIAGPGFLNFYLKQSAKQAALLTILEQDAAYGRSNHGNGLSVMIEFVSSNPTGPLHVGHGRGAAYGATLANLLSFAGYRVHREYYVNDAGRQMDILTVSVWLRYLGLSGQHFTFPTKAYQGDYIIDIAKEIKEAHQEEYFALAEEVFNDLGEDDGDPFIDSLIKQSKAILGEANYRTIHAVTLHTILSSIKEDLLSFKVHFDEWFSENRLVSEGAIELVIEKLKTKNHTYEKDGALWFKATAFGDDKDRVLIRANGQATYFASDVAYHFNKFDRDFDLIIDVFGADHHGYIPRLKAALKALDYDPNAFQVPVIQFATLYRGSTKVPMSTRSGQYVTLSELVEEVGTDAARYFYVQRKHSQHMDFDLELAKSQNQDNPVYSIQYAHARICSVFKQLIDKGWYFKSSDINIDSLTPLKTEQEFLLIDTLNTFPEVIEQAAIHQEPHVLTHYLHELALAFHRYYHQSQFLVEDLNIRNARLALIAAIRIVIKNGLNLLDISAPEAM